VTTLDAKTAVMPATKQPVPRSAAERMRAHRDRRKDGLRCVMIQLFEEEVDNLIRKGLLNADARNNKYAVCEALHKHLDLTLRAAS